MYNFLAQRSHKFAWRKAKIVITQQIMILKEQVPFKNCLWEFYVPNLADCNLLS